MRREIFIMSALVLFLGSVALVQAQEEIDPQLQATIREVILTDPRSSEMTEAEIDAIVTTLAAEAEAQGVTSEDITWRPQGPTTFEEGTAAEETCGYPAFLCELNNAFGFSGNSLDIPFLLGITSALLLFIIGSILLHSHGQHPFAGNLRKGT